MLNARPEAQEGESQVIAQAGMPGAITLATNMAGALRMHVSPLGLFLAL